MSEPTAPPIHMLADDEDTLDWDRDELGPMAAQATADGAVTTVPFDGGEC